MKTLLTILAALIVSQTASAKVSAPFQISTANYQDYRGITTPVTFVAIAKIKPQQVENFKKIVDSLVPVMRAQSGNIYYDLHQSLSDSSEFMFLEEWHDGKSMADHMDSAAVQELVAKAGPLFESGFPKFIILKKN